MRKAVQLTSFAFLTSVCLADTILVDASNGPGTDYTDLPQALQAASQNDLILVRAGDYSPFTTSKGVRILALEVNVVVSGRCVIQSLHSARKFVLYGLELNEVEVRDCGGHVSLNKINGWPWLRHMKISNSVDVRVSGVRIEGGESYAAAVDVVASEVEFVRCDIEGWTGFDDWDDAGAYGTIGVLIDDDSRARISLCDIEGGSGADVWTEWYVDVGDGAPAVHVRGGSEVTITGDGTQVLQGGHCGWGGQFASEPGYGASGLYVEERSQARVSGVNCQGGFGPSSWVQDQLATAGSVIEEPTPADPTLEMLGDAIPGQSLTMRVTGPPGGNVRYLLGRIPQLNYLPGGFGPDLLLEIRIVNPGVIPASGVRDYDFTLPGNLPQGMYFLGQAKVVYQGTAYRTPSQVLLVR